MNDQELVRKCLLLACAKLGFDESAMTQRDFELLSGEIESHTSTLISVSTIKRLLHGEFSRLPQAATLNAISTYLGYKNWHDFKLSEKEKAPAPIAESAIVQKPMARKKPVLLTRWKLVAGIVLIASALVVAGFLTISSKSPAHLENASFSVKKTITKGIPNTVVFNYNIDNVEADSFFIQQSWDENRRVRIKKNTYTLTDIYYEPGYHIAKLMANDKIIKTFDVSIPTDDWFFFAKDFQPKSIPQYIRPAKSVSNGIFALTETDLLNSHVDAQQPLNYAYLNFPGKLEVSADNFIYKARVRVKEVRNNFCPALMCEVFSQNHFMFVKSTAKGCENEAMIGFGENFQDGKRNDLSPLGLDLQQWTDIEITVREKLATIFFNGKKVYTVPYTTSAGYITGLGFISNGLCEVDQVDLRGLDGKLVYSSQFD